MVITTRYLEDDLFEASNEMGASSRIDMRNKEIKKNLSPVEGLLGSLGTCIGGDVIDILRKRRKTVIGLTLVTNGTRRDHHPRAITAIWCKVVLESPDATVEELAKAAQLVVDKYCSVASSLKPSVDLSCEIIRPA
jgi:putative redox protein